jgi:[acyl-carrier-protein] S-malonyltransferase
MSQHSQIFAVFPGQGSQHVGMAQDLYANFALVKELFEEASDAIHIDLKKLCFEGPESDLTLTENTQPCLLTASVAAFRVAEKELGFVPGAVAGHSLGEYSALVATGSVQLGAAVRWVRERGLAMQKAVPVGEGTMAAILGLDDALILSLCKKATAQAIQKRAENSGDPDELSVEAIVEPANYNSPGQVVIAGSTDGITESIHLVKTDLEFAGGKIIPLQVSAPFHCKLMAPARERMAEIFSQVGSAHRPKMPNCPYVPNRTGRMTRETGLVFELLIDQVDHPVLWKQSINALLDAGYTHSVEFGPGKVLSGLIKRIAAPSTKKCTQLSVNESSHLKNLDLALKSLQGAHV